MKKCRYCQGVKPPRAHHCSRCNRCVLRMDHHCRWVNNCIGQRNLKQFVLFVFYLGVNCLYITITYLTVAVSCIINSARDKSNRQICYDSDSPMIVTYLLTTTGTAMLNLLVFAFCCCLFGNQLHLINKNRSFIDNLSERIDNFGIEQELADKYENNDQQMEF